MRLGELVLRIGDQTRTFFWSSTSRYVFGKDIGTTPLAYLEQADPEVFCVDALFHSLEGKLKKDKMFSKLTVVKWMGDVVKNEAGEELDKIDLAIEILYARARSLVGKEGETEIAKLDIMFNPEKIDEDGEGPLVEG